MSVLITPLQAAVLATFDFTTDSLAVTSELFSGSTGNITLGSQYSTDADSLLYTADVNSSGFLGAATNTFSFSYTVTGLAAGESLSLDSLDFDYTGFDGSVRVSATDTGTFVGDEDPASGDGSFSSTSNLTSTGLVNGDTVTVEFGIRDAPGTDQTFTLDNFTLNGTIVPEPTSSVLLGLGALGLLARRKR